MSNFELAAEVDALGICVEPFHIKIQPAFADRDRPLALDPGFQHRQMFGAMFGEIHRVQTVSRIQASLVATECTQLVEAGQGDRRHDLSVHAARARTRKYLRAIGVEFGNVDMRMAVDQFGHGSLKTELDAD